MSQAKLRELAKDLALAVDPQLEFDRVWFDSTRDWVLEELRKEARGGHQKEWKDVKKPLLGHAEIARVKVQDDLADGLLQLIGRMEEHQQRGQGDWNDDLPLKTRNITQHIQLLLNLASPATSSTHAAAYELLHRQAPTGPTPDELLYQEIMSERFTGDHWGKGYNEEVKLGWTDSEEEDEETSSDEEIITPHIKKGPTGVNPADLERARQREEAETRMHEARRTLQALEKGAYWKHPPAFSDALPEGLSGWKSVSTEFAALSLAEGKHPTSDVTVVSSSQLQREMLFALSGRPGVFFDMSEGDGTFSLCNSHPSVRHFSRVALQAILDRVESRSRQLLRIRDFSKSPQNSRTAQAFADCCRSIIADVGIWIGDIEQSLVLGVPSGSRTAASTPLQIMRDFDAAHGGLFDHLECYLDLADRPVLLLNAIAIHLDIVPPPVATALRTIWLRSAEPMWTMLRDWLVRGMPVPGFLLDAEGGSEVERELPGEFFIRRDGDVEWGDEDFWDSAYGENEEGYPVFLEDAELKESVVEAGKARGLLMALGQKPSLPVDWMSLESLIRLSDSAGSDSAAGMLENIRNAVSAHLSPICALVTFQLRRVLDEDCGLLSHLNAIEGLLYMRNFPVIADWSQWLFKQISDGSRWSDLHLLTGNLRDCIEQNQAAWMNAPAIRISTIRTPRGNTPGLEAVRASYQVPVPLSQIFSPTSMELRAEVFTFLLRVLHARRHVLEGFKELFELNACDTSAEERAERMLRQRLGWFLETLWSWIMNIIDIEVERYGSQIIATTSLKAMISLELVHTRRIRDFCFLHDHSTEPRDAINVILQLALKRPDAGHTRPLLVWRSENARLATRVLQLRGKVEELAGAGERGLKGGETRSGWSTLAVALQDWR